MRLLEPTNEYILRKAVVRKLLKEGWHRKDIRIEIPMSTASSGGRADIVCLNDSYIGCIELKSGKDKLQNDLVRQQLEQYRRAFDHCALIVDYILKREIRTIRHNGYSTDDNFRHVSLLYRKAAFGAGCFTEKYDEEAKRPLEKITPHIFNRRSPERLTSVYDMAAIMWADELRQALNSSKTKSALEIFARDNYGVKEFRPMLLKALRERPLNDWEIGFWKQLDEDNEKIKEKENGK